MGLIDQKKNIFTTIGAYTSVGQAGTPPNTTNIFPSINNKKDIVPLLLDILKVVVGSNALQQLTGELFTNLIDNIEPNLKSSIKKQNIQSNSGEPLPNFNVNVPVKNIDFTGKYKTNPMSAQGILTYGSSGNDFDNVAYKAITNGSSTFGGILNINYNSVTDSFAFSPVNSGGATIGTFMDSMVDHMTIIDKKTFMTNAMNLFYGSVTGSQGKTVEELTNELQVAKLIEQLINDNASFEILPEDYESILRKAQELSKGVNYYDLGCGVMEVVFPLSGMTDLISSISGSTNSFFVGNQINNTIDTSTKNNPVATENNKQTIKDSFFQKLIDLITQTLANAVCTTPQIRTILAISSSFQNNGETQIGNPLDDLKKFRIYLKCNINSAMALINKFIFDLVTTFLIALLNPIVRSIIKEKINQYVGIIKSLTGTNIL